VTGVNHKDIGLILALVTGASEAMT